MLSILSVQNFAIIDNITIDFKPGLTILTGETGAGKSLIIDAIGLLLGDRASSAWVRSGYQKAIIEGVFTDYSEKIKLLLKQFGLEIIDDEALIIRKEISLQGKSTTRINGRIVTIGELNQISDLLADIHTQEDTKKLFKSSFYIDFIESSASIPVLKSYQAHLAIYQKALKAYQKIVKQAQEDAQQLDFIRFQADEISKAALIIDEEESLVRDLNLLNNFENIYRLQQTIKTIFDDANIIGNLYDASQQLNKLNAIDPKYVDQIKTLNNAYYELDDFLSNLNADFSHLEFDENKLDFLNQRLRLLSDLKRKHQKSIPELIDYHAELKMRIDNFEHIEDDINDLKKDVLTSHQAVLEDAKALSALRQANALNLTNEIKNTLKELHLPDVDLEIIFKTQDLSDPFLSDNFRNNGIDIVEIMISFNRGEPLKELAKVASGGELSRVMLALKVHLLKNMHLSTMIFDEIDQGVSGEVASSIAAKLKEISKSSQVLAITHLPIVASAADQHLFVTKRITGGRTITKLDELSMEQRVNNLAQMLAPDVNDANIIKLSQEMILRWKNN